MLRDENEVVSDVHPMLPAHLHFGRHIIDNMKTGGDHIALIDGVTGEKLTYKQLVDSVTRCACGLDRIGVRHGHMVAVLSENRLEVLISVLASICCGAIVSTINPSYSKDEFTHAIKIVKPSLVFYSQSVFERNGETLKSLLFNSKLVSFDDSTDSNKRIYPFRELLNQPVDVDLFEPREVKGQTDGAVVLFSSGTTGLPKGVVLTHMNLMVSSTSISGEFMTKSGVKTMLTVSPWSHSMGLISVFNYLNNLRTVVFLPRFNEELCYKLIQDYRINGFSVPSALVVLMAKSGIIDNYDLSSLKTLLAGSAPLSLEVIQIASKRLGGIKICQGYGLTETTVGIIRDTVFNPRRKPKIGSSGGVLTGVRVKVVDENGKSLPAYGRGELRFKSPNVMKEYLGNPDATAQAFDEDGYLKTGDIGYYDSEGYFFIVDRIKELIKYKGFQVPPAEVETVLLDHEAVRECGVVGTPDEEAGELPTAFVVRQPGSSVTERELVDHVASKLSRAKHLHGGVRFIKEIPKSGSGKVLRRVLRDMCKNTPPSKL